MKITFTGVYGFVKNGDSIGYDGPLLESFIYLFKKMKINCFFFPLNNLPKIKLFNVGDNVVKERITNSTIFSKKNLVR